MKNLRKPGTPGDSKSKVMEIKEPVGITLNFSFNAMHGNNIDYLKTVKGATETLELFGKEKIPCIVGLHGLDMLFFPELGDIFQKYPTLGKSNGLFGHVLPSIQGNNFVYLLQKFGAELIQPNINNIFLPEFSIPFKENIKNESIISQLQRNNFFFLKQATRSYSLCGQEEPFFEGKSILEARSVRYNTGQLGISMVNEDFKPILDAMFLAMRLPYDLHSTGMSNIDYLIDQIANIKNHVTVPLDLEAAGGIGSALGAGNFWNLFFNKIKARGLEKMFLGFNEIYPYYEAIAEETDKIITREISKWGLIDKCLLLYRDTSAFSNELQKLSFEELEKLTIKDIFVLTIACCADAQASISQNASKEILLPAIKQDGSKTMLKIGGNPLMIKASYWALNSLRESGFSFKKLRRRENHSFEIFYNKIKNKQQDFYKILSSVCEKIENMVI